MDLSLSGKASLSEDKVKLNERWGVMADRGAGYAILCYIVQRIA